MASLRGTLSMPYRETAAMSMKPLPEFSALACWLGIARATVVCVRGALLPGPIRDAGVTQDPGLIIGAALPGTVNQPACRNSCN